MASEKAAYSCRKATVHLKRALTALARHEALIADISELAPALITSCPSCQKGAVKYCTGWRLEVGEYQMVCPVRTKLRGASGEAHLHILGQADYRRAEPAARGGWEAAPLRRANFAGEVRMAVGDTVVHRFHVDLAEPDQFAPGWHLQFGGAPQRQAGGAPSELPRWPVAPMDLLLFTDAALMNYAPDAWHSLHADPEWVHVLKKSEELILPQYRNWLNAYMDQTHGSGSWSGAQATTTGWPARPE